ncbi:uncharacterized protein [Spinacia oleracea]|uniref:Retrotransposon Copia-like N-terminal domain-containing protein n=1 Tax=Spinacia oleracea TaxID=3562 RepID=A0ABM3RSK2_SPIOL|nr:uncharacterized protein LOC130472161 [Spinacia oleracea]XP_056698610.1 uncharacterized protein LOC130472162 [Spinacia oleracea]
MAILDSKSDNSHNNTNNGGNADNSDPYFIANSDHPTSSLVVVLFTGVNFVRWSRNVKRALVAKNKEGFINGDITKPAVNHKDYIKWKRTDFMVVSWILSSMNHDLADDFGYIDNAADLWCELNERFGQSNGPLVYQLKKEIENLTQQNMTIVAYYGKLKKLWDEMQNLRAFPSSTCGAMLQCSCQFMKKVAEFEEEDKMMKFLLGLNVGFDNTVTNVDPLPNINKVFSITQQIEKQKELSGATADCNAMTSSAMAAQAYRGNQSQLQKNNTGSGKKDWKEIKREKMNRVCTHCKGKGHTADQCFKLIGYPDWYNSIKASKGQNSTGNRLAAHVNYNAEIGDEPLGNADNENGMVNNEMLNAICQEVMKVMKGKQNQGTETSGAHCSYANYAGIISHSFNCTVDKLHDASVWIVDSGACDHMTYDKTILTNIRTLTKPIKVGLPDGSQLNVDTIGDTALSTKLVLHNVLLVQGSKHNLLSVGRLIERTNLHVLFTGAGYTFQDPANSELLGAGKRTNGLYYFVLPSHAGFSTGTVSKQSNCNNVENMTDSSVMVLPNKTATSASQAKMSTENKIHMFHPRLGHPSLSKMRYIDADCCKGLSEYNCVTLCAIKQNIINCLLLLVQIELMHVLI